MIIFTDTLLEAFALNYVRSFLEYIQERRGFMYNFMLAFLICCVSYIIGICRQKALALRCMISVWKQ